MKRRIFLVAAVVCIIAIIACGSLAYFTDKSTKTNKFMTAAYNPEDPSEPEPDDVFSIVVNEDGKATADELKADPDLVDGTEVKDDKDNVTGLNYTDVLPGSKLVKKASVTNTGDYDAYVRMQITISNADEWYKILGADNKADNLVSKLTDIKNSAKWAYVSGANDGKSKTVTYVYNYTDVLTDTAPTTDNIFNKVIIPADITKEQFVEVDGFTISLLGEAIQADYTGDNVADAFKKYDAQENPPV